MNRFTENVPLVLTPLTPIHIGCGEDFEPTNYVIDNGVLYAFEPADLALNESDRRELRKRAGEPGLSAILAVQRFFHERRSQCRAASRLSMPVVAGVAEWYEKRVGRVVQREGGGLPRGNELGIERSAHHPYTGKPYLPGSSLKGSARTGWLNGLDRDPQIPRDPRRGPGREERSAEVERKLLGGSFSSDPFRLVEFSDAAGAELCSTIVFAVDRRKQPRPDDAEKNLAVIREAVAGGQFRAARGEIRFRARPTPVKPGDAPRADKCIGDFATLARACNRFYQTRLEADLQVLARLGETRWADAFQALIAALRPALDDGRAMLLRVGRHSGAESVTLDRHRWIRIMEGPGQAHWARDATTIWLAADHQDVRTGVRPFGWLLLERADDLLGDDQLRRWCDAQTATAAAAGAAAPRSAARSHATQAAPGETVWERARLQYNREDGRLTALGPGNLTAYADDDAADDVLDALGEAERRGLRAGRYVFATVRVRGRELIGIETTR